MAIALVQSKTAASGAGVASLNLVFDSAPTNGNTLVLSVATNAGVFIASTADIIWTGTSDTGASNTIVELWIGRVITASASATVTITVGTGGASIAVAGAEFSGFTRSRIDKSVAATATSTAANSGNTATTSASSQLWVSGISARLTGGVTYSNAFLGGIAATNLFQNTTNLGTTADRSAAFLFRIVATTGVANANATLNSSGIWIERIITIEDTPVGGGLRAAGHGGLAA